MTPDDIKSFSDLVIYISSMISGIVLLPFRFIALIFQIPNVKIVYKSGHVEYYFFKNWKCNFNGQGEITSMDWITVGNKQPKFIGLNEIESVVGLW